MTDEQMETVEMCTLAVTQNGRALEFVPEELKSVVRRVSDDPLNF